MDIQDLMDEFFDNTVIAPNEKSALQQRVTHSGFNAFRPDKYSKFMGIINKKFAFLDKIYSKFNEEIQFRSENKELHPIYKRVSIIIENAINFVAEHTIDDDTCAFIVAGILLCRFEHHGFRDFVYPKHRKINIYDIVRYYMVYITMQICNLKSDDISITQRNINAIEFGNVSIYPPIINGYSIPPYIIYDFIKFTGLKKFLKQNELKKTAYKLHINLENEYGGDNEIDVINPSHDEIIKYIDKLHLALFNFMILEGSKELNDLAFIQTRAIFEEEDVKTFSNLYWILAEKREPQGNLTTYGNEVNKETLIEIFQSFLSGKTPNLSEWEYLPASNETQN